MSTVPHDVPGAPSPSGQGTMLRAPDHGPWYAETSLGVFPAEPANTLSNLVFLLILAWGWRKLRSARIRGWFFPTALVLLGIGWIGGTVYHATRSSAVWLFMDFLPIGILCLMGCVWMVWKLPKRPRTIYLIVGLPVQITLWLMTSWLEPSPARIGAGYAVLGSLIALPCLLHSALGGWSRLGQILLALSAFGGALTFRSLDAHFIGPEPTLGTHFLWHLLGGLATWLILDYLFHLAQREKIQG